MMEPHARLSDEEDITAGNMGAAFVDVDNDDEWMEWVLGLGGLAGRAEG